MSAARWAPKPLGGDRVCVRVCFHEAACIHLAGVCALAAGVFSAASVPERSHAYSQSPVHFFLVCEFDVSALAERLNNAQRNRHNEWMRVRLPLTNFLCDLSRSTVPPVTASWDTQRRTCPPPLLRCLRTVRAEFLKSNTDCLRKAKNARINFYI